MNWNKTRRKVFENMAQSIHISTHPEFESHVAQQAWAITEGALSYGRHVSFDPVFYVYVLMDSGKPGPFSYTLPHEGPTISFSHEPFYVGKGKGRRRNAHVQLAKSSKTKSHKLNRIRKILNAGNRIIVRRVSSELVEPVALAKEIALIAAIGRARAREGPLTNATIGGEGVSGMEISDQTRRRMREAWQTRDPVVKAALLARAHEAAATSWLGRTHGETARQKIGNANRGRVKSAEVRANHSRLMKDRVFTAEHRARLSLAGKGVPKSATHRARVKASWESRPFLTCPHCGKQGRAMMTRWHFDNCKHK